MRKLHLTTLLFTGLLLGASAALADSPDKMEAEQVQETGVARAEYEAMLEEVEKARVEAESARREAIRVAERAREMAHAQAGEAREQMERSRRDLESAERVREKAAQREEMEKVREELSRTHRELREASREVARAHRDLSRADHEFEITTEINLGDRAVIGVVLGRQSDEGVEIIGVSPDGPAERAGLQPGDVLESINGKALANNRDARQTVFDVMGEVGDGEELTVAVNRNGQSLEYTVTAEIREPRSWQSIIRIPEAPLAPVGPGSPEAPHVIVERMQVPEIDEAALAAEIAELAERIEGQTYHFVTKDGKTIEEFRFDTDDFSELGRHAMSDADIWFGLPQARGLELASINEDLGRYFKTDRGVLVIKARKDNAYTLESGDVILAIGKSEVNSPSDMMRALRDVDEGSELVIEIKRDRKNKTLRVSVPENRLGYR